MGYTVKNRTEAWNKANELFPTDYMKDERSSQNAGYPIYESTASDNRSWISDLGNRLELNIWGKGGVESINIWIEEEPVIVEHTYMTVDDVRACCIRNDLYDCGTVKDYDAMLRKAEEPFSLRLLYEIAVDICDHTDGENTITNIMAILNKEAVTTWYEI